MFDPEEEEDGCCGNGCCEPKTYTINILEPNPELIAVLMGQEGQ